MVWFSESSIRFDSGDRLANVGLEFQLGRIWPSLSWRFLFSFLKTFEAMMFFMPDRHSITGDPNRIQGTSWGCLHWVDLDWREWISVPHCSGRVQCIFVPRSRDNIFLEDCTFACLAHDWSPTYVNTVHTWILSPLGKKDYIVSHMCLTLWKYSTRLTALRTLQCSIRCILFL